MHRRSSRLVTAALALAGTLTALTTTAPAASAATAPATTAPASARPSATEHAEVLLNGDLILSTGNHGYAVSAAAPGLASATLAIHHGTDFYEVPVAAMPYVGRGLDPSLFDVTRLPRDGRLPIEISYRGARPVLPGVTFTGAHNGYLTAASAKLFGTALLRQFGKDRTARSFGTDGMFAGGVRLSLAGARIIAARRLPRLPMDLLTMRGITLKGTPDSGDFVFVVNMDDFSRVGTWYTGSQGFFDNGTVKYSVAAGHYLAIAVFGLYDTAQDGLHIVVNPAFTVAGTTTVTMDERTATSRFSISTPRPIVNTPDFWTVHLSDSCGAVSDLNFEFSSDYVPFYISPTTRHPLAGTMRVVVNARPMGTDLKYAYDLSFAGPPNLISRSQKYTASAANLATLTGRYHTDATQYAGVLRVPVYQFNSADTPWWLWPVSVLKTPVTHYVSAGSPTIYWQTQYMSNYPYGGQVDSSRTYLPGERITEDWNAYPLHPALNTSVLGGHDIYPTTLSATRSGDAMSFDIYPFGDSVAGHGGAGFWPGDTGGGPPPMLPMSGSYELDRNGVKIARGNADQSAHGIYALAAKINVSPDPGVYRLTFDASRGTVPSLISFPVKTHTVWTWRSAHESGKVLQAGWVCPDQTRSCAAEPLMTLGYNVAGLGENEVAPAGAQVVRIWVGHQQLATAATITGLTASISTDGGTSWQPASVTGSGATWEAAFNAPAGRKVSLRVQASDKAGGSITETAWNAYTVSGAAASAGYRNAGCVKAKAGQAGCFLLYSPQTAAVRGGAAGFGAVAAPTGWGATAIAKAYRLPVKRSGGTVAVVDAYDTPVLEHYLSVYRQQYGLPPCTTANGCFRKVNQNGKASPLPAPDRRQGWDLETALDVEMVSAACPRCHILVVETNSPYFSDLSAGVNAAARLGAVAISNSYGAQESGYMMPYSAAYHHPGHTIVAASGDWGFSTSVSFPADLTSVTAVGGTELHTAHNGRGYSEAVWNQQGLGAGSSGCSAYVTKPKWQHDADCRGRTIADVSALASDVAVYELDYGGWLMVGGTSAASPIIAGVYALAGNATTVAPGSEYAHPAAFFDITTGNNEWLYNTGGRACGYDYLCMAKKGYDAPTGIGTPVGITGF